MILAKEINKEQKEQGWPGLVKEVSEICQEVGIEDFNEHEISKEKVNEEIFHHHYKEMKEDISKMKKLEDIKNEDFREVKDYMKSCAIKQARLKLSLRSQMYDCRANYPGKYEEDNRGCPACIEAGGQDRQVVEEESQSHLSICPHYSDLRAGLDIYTTEGQVFLGGSLREGQGVIWSLGP